MLSFDLPHSILISVLNVVFIMISFGMDPQKERMYDA